MKHFGKIRVLLSLVVLCLTVMIYAGISRAYTSWGLVCTPSPLEMWVEPGETFTVTYTGSLNPGPDAPPIERIDWLDSRGSIPTSSYSETYTAPAGGGGYDYSVSGVIFANIYYRVPQTGNPVERIDRGGAYSEASCLVHVRGTATPTTTPTATPTYPPYPTPTATPTYPPYPTPTYPPYPPYPTPTYPPYPYPTYPPYPTPAPSPTSAPPLSPVTYNWEPDKEIGNNRVGESWVPDGRLIAPVDQRTGSGQKTSVMPSTLVSCAVEAASDFDTLTTTTPANPPTPGKSETSYQADSPLTYSWSATGGTFEGATNTLYAYWRAPRQPGRYIVKCVIDDPPGARIGANSTGSRDDPAVTRGFEVIVPTIAITFKQNTLAIGSKNDDAHKAKFEVKATDDSGNPVSDFHINLPIVVQGTGRDPYNGTSAKVEMESMVTNSNGIVKGKLKSGNRLETTQIRIQTDLTLQNPNLGPSASAQQVWSDLGADAWDYEPYFNYDEPSTIKYHMAYTRDGVKENIKGHTMEPETTTITGYEWDENAGEDWDEDGWPDGDYAYQTYDKDDNNSSGYDDWSGLVEWGDVSEDDGTYTAPQTIHYDEDFELDSVYFNLADTNSYGSNGSRE